MGIQTPLSGNSGDPHCPFSPGQAPEVNLTTDVGPRSQNHPQSNLRSQLDKGPREGKKVSPEHPEERIQEESQARED